MNHTVYKFHTWFGHKSDPKPSVVRLTLPPRSVVPPSEARTTSAPAEWATWLTTDFHGWQAWVQAVWKRGSVLLGVSSRCANAPVYIISCYFCCQICISRFRGDNWHWWIHKLKPSVLLVSSYVVRAEAPVVADQNNDTLDSTSPDGVECLNHIRMCSIFWTQSWNHCIKYKSMSSANLSHLRICFSTSPMGSPSASIRSMIWDG